MLASANTFESDCVLVLLLNKHLSQASTAAWQFARVPDFRSECRKATDKR